MREVEEAKAKARQTLIRAAEEKRSIREVMQSSNEVLAKYDTFKSDFGVTMQSLTDSLKNLIRENSGYGRVYSNQPQKLEVK